MGAATVVPPIRVAALIKARTDGSYGRARVPTFHSPYFPIAKMCVCVVTYSVLFATTGVQ